MANDHRLRVYVDYQVLLLADFRFITRHVETAYNALQAAEMGTKRVSRSDRLSIEAINTGNSLTLLCLGGIALGSLITITERVFKLRETAWKSEKTKWEALKARTDYEEMVETRVGKQYRQPSERAEALIAELADRVLSSGNMRTLEVQVDEKTVRLGGDEGDEDKGVGSGQD